MRPAASCACSCACPACWTLSACSKACSRALAASVALVAACSREKPQKCRGRLRWGAGLQAQQHHDMLCMATSGQLCWSLCVAAAGHQVWHALRAAQHWGLQAAGHSALVLQDAASSTCRRHLLAEAARAAASCALPSAWSPLMVASSCSACTVSQLHALALAVKQTQTSTSADHGSQVGIPGQSTGPASLEIQTATRESATVHQARQMEGNGQ